jgi:hypothetical protein
MNEIINKIIKATKITITIINLIQGLFVFAIARRVGFSENLAFVNTKIVKCELINYLSINFYITTKPK